MILIEIVKYFSGVLGDLHFILPPHSTLWLFSVLHKDPFHLDALAIGVTDSKGDALLGKIHLDQKRPHSPGNELEESHFHPSRLFG